MFRWMIFPSHLFLFLERIERWMVSCPWFKIIQAKAFLLLSSPFHAMNMVNSKKENLTLIITSIKKGNLAMGRYFCCEVTGTTHRGTKLAICLRSATWMALSSSDIWSHIILLYPPTFIPLPLDIKPIINKNLSWIVFVDYDKITHLASTIRLLI